jgi:hypothetical protein
MRNAPRMQSNGTGQNTPVSNLGCFICQNNHPHLACVDFNSEISLRIALDNLRRSRGDSSTVQNARAGLTRRLRELAAHAT